MINNDIKRKRDDLSTFLIHLTRKTDKGEAKDNLINIINNFCIEARNPKGLFYKIDKIKEQVKSACFTEVPLSNIKHLIGFMPGREVQLSSYGLVFTKDYLVNKGANPVFHINTYYSDERKKVIMDVIRGLPPEQQKEIAPYLDIFGETYDFHWEREWRLNGDLNFRGEDVVVGLCEENDIKTFERITEGKIEFVSPFMSLEEIIERLIFK
jgi:hypothetical protein